MLGVVLALQGKKDKALDNFRAALPILNSNSRASENEKESSASRELRLKIILETYIDLLAEAVDKPFGSLTSAAATSEGFRIANIARSRSVQVALAASGARAAAGNPDLADLVRREQDTRKQISALFGLYANALSAAADQQDKKAQTSLRKRIDILRNARAVLAQEIEKRFPDYAALMNPKPATIELAQKALRPGEALIATYVADLFVTDESSASWLI